MELRHLRYFVAAVEEGSMQGAASRMNVAQPALSRRIRDLEIRTGCDLLTRGARGVTPTRAGASLYRDALRLLEGLDEARQQHESNARLGAGGEARVKLAVEGAGFQHATGAARRVGAVEERLGVEAKGLGCRCGCRCRVDGSGRGR